MTVGTTQAGRLSALSRPRFGGLAGLRAVILLAGSVRATELSRSIGRSLLDLPLGPGRTVLGQWHSQVGLLSEQLGAGAIPVRAILDREGLRPRVPSGSTGATLSIEHERGEFRGTGGVLRDSADEYGPDDRLLVANAAQVLTCPLSDVVADLLTQEADVALVAHDDGTPSGLVVVRCAVLQGIRPTGFVDFKEQVLPRLAAAGHSIRVVRRAQATGIPVRTLGSYLSGLRTQALAGSGRDAIVDPFDEDWAPTFAVVEEGAEVAPGATIHDSVVLSGARVGSGAVVVRSLVCPGAVVRPGATVADRIVAAHERRASQR